jgi:hypothetical protein
VGDFVLAVSLEPGPHFPLRETGAAASHDAHSVIGVPLSDIDQQAVKHFFFVTGTAFDGWTAGGSGSHSVIGCAEKMAVSRCAAA